MEVSTTTEEGKVRRRPQESHYIEDLATIGDVNGLI
jgi:hypothetical protein